MLLKTCRFAPTQGRQTLQMISTTRNYSTNDKPEDELPFMSDKMKRMKYFLRLETLFKNTPGSKMSEEQYKKVKDKYWPELDEDIKETENYIGGVFRQEAPEPPKFKPYDLDTDEGYTRSLSYLSSHFHNRPNPPELKKTEDADEPLEPSFKQRFPVNEVLKISRHTQVTAGGRVFSFSALIMLGTGKGTAGIGYGRGNSVPEAVNLAKNNAQKNLISIDLWRGNHIGGFIKQKYKRSYIIMKPRRAGSGRIGGKRMDLVLDAFGIEDVIVGKDGSSNKHTIYRALFKGLREQTRSPRKVSRMLGRKFFERGAVFYHTYD